jgi:hypothetical protein
MSVLSGKFIFINAMSKETTQINNLIHIKLQEKQKQTKLQNSRCRQIIKMRAEIN